MAERSIVVKLRADVAGFKANIASAKKSVDDLTKPDTKKPQKAFDDLANKGALMGGAIALGVGKAVSSFVEFDAAMSGVAANSGATGAELESLRQKAMQLGADTQFSATEAAKGIDELAKAGVRNADILNGGLKGALDLAAAGQIDVAQAAETTASALNQFGLEGGKAVHVADLLSNASSAAQGGVGDMAQALAQAGVAANATGLNIDETTTLLALFAKSGMIGSDAGTSLKTMLQRLIPQTDAAATAMEELGLHAYDAQGNFVGAEELIRQLSEGTKDLSQETKMAALNTIFGSDAIRAASIAASAGADGYKAMNKEVTEAGGAARRAGELTDNLKGDIERLGGSLDTAFIQTGSAANGALRDLVKGLGSAVDVIAQIPAPITLAAAGLGAIALTLPKGISVYRSFTDSLDTLGLSLDKIAAKAPKTAAALNLLKGAGIVVGVAAVADSILSVHAAAEVADVSVDSLANSLQGLAGKGQLQGGIADLFRHKGGLLVADEQFVSTADAIERFNTTAYDALSDNNLPKLLRGLQPGAGDKFDKYVNQIDAALAQMVNSGNADAAKASLDALINGIDDPQVRAAARKAFTEYDTALKNVKDKADLAGDGVGGLNGKIDATPGGVKVADGAMSDFGGTLEGVGGKAKDAKDELQNLLDLADSMAGNKRDLAAARAGLADAGDAAIEAAKAKGGNDPDAIKAQADATKDLAEAEKELAKARKTGKKGNVERATKGVEQAQDRLTQANKRVADSYVAPEKAQRDYEAAMRRVGEQGDSLIDSLIKQNKPISEINKAYEDQRAELIKAANARGIHGAAAEAEADKVSKTKEQMDDLRFQYAHTQAYVDTQVRTPGLPEAKKGMEGYWEVIDGVPTFKPTTVTTPGIEDAQSKLDGVWEVTNGIPRFIPITVSVQTLGQLPVFGGYIGLASTLAGAAGKPFADGGYTGNGGKYQPAGVVHKGEVVWSQDDIRRWGGVHVVESMRRAPGYSDGGVVGRAVAPSAMGGFGFSEARFAAAVAAAMPPILPPIYSGDDAYTAARKAYRDEMRSRDRS